MTFVYFGLLAACLVGTAPLEVFLRTRVYARPRRWLLSLLPVVALFTAWDAYAISQRHWAYDKHQTTGIQLGNVPLEEIAFFVVIPTCAILTYEAVLAVRAARERR